MSTLRAEIAAATDAEPRPLPFARHESVAGVATAFCVGGAGDAFGRIVELTALQRVHGGIAAVTPDPMPIGAEVSIGFSAPGHLACRGRVSQCEPCVHGYRVTVLLLTRAAA